MDEVVIYNRALTAEEIRDHYSAGMGNEIIPDANTIGLWHFDEGFGTTAIDASGNGYDGTIYGATYVGKASWHDETPSETRGERRKFPPKAYLVATDSGLDIIDAGDNTLWMRFIAAADSQLPVGGNAISARNGKVYVGTSNGLYVIDFVNDNVVRYDASGLAVSDSPIVERNAVNFYSVQDSVTSIVDSTVNYVHTAVINGETFIAVGTDAGASVINETAGTVVNMTGAPIGKISSVFISEDDTLYAAYHSVAGIISVYDISQRASDILMCGHGANSYSANYQNGIVYRGSDCANLGGLPLIGYNINELFVTPGTSSARAGDNTLYVATDAGLTVLQEWQDNEANGTVLHIGSNVSSNTDIDYPILVGYTEPCTSVAVSGNTMWVGTNDGAWGGAVSQVDLTNNSLTSSFTMESTPSIVYDNVTVLAGDAGNLLVGTDFGATAIVGEPFWQNIVSGSDGITTTSGIGSFEWDTSLLPEGTDYKIRIRAYDGQEYGPYDESDGTFEINVTNGNRPPVITSSPTTEFQFGAYQGNSQIIDLSSWEVVRYDFVQTPAEWVLDEGNTVARISYDHNPSIFLSDVDLQEDIFQGTWEVGEDDDLIGFVFGYQDSGHFYLFDWKRTDQEGWSLAESGMGVKVVSADTPLTIYDIWPTAGNGDRVKTIFHNSIPFKVHSEYMYTLEFHPGEFTITVFDGCLAIASVSIHDSTYSSGRFGFYNHSQDCAYRGFMRQAMPTCEYVYDVDATDEENDLLTYNLTIAPAGMTIDAHTGLINWMPAYTDVGSHDVEVMVFDGNGGEASQQFTIIVSDTNL